MQRVFIVLPVHNRRRVTEKFVDCLRQQTYEHFQLILVDDGSADGTADAVRAKVDSVTVIRGRGNWWWAGSLQQGLNAVKAMRPVAEDILFICNDDVEFEANFLATAVTVLQARSRTLVLAREKNAATGEIAETGIAADFRQLSFGVAADPLMINCLSTRGLFLRWGDAEVIGGFHPRLLPHYLSDYEWTIRAHRRGLRCITVPELHVVYQPTGPSGRVDFAAGSRPIDLLRRSLSKKSRVNPVNFVVFILLAADWRSMPIALTKLFQRMYREAVRQIFHAGERTQ
jgi:GT2 family glycosyltransferase